ncbi:hypothetical protein RclHR1_04530005 [Rhizophagus clarus]|uniref:Uncharacterized protein n=1 Tax=Rhizophagus clarus TaxID=94130 RepID=A0A2Z6RMW6_9GLOM|nr:hypothetical protein RclHR1_04530005 [Rhizophagus clarus]
MKCRDLVLEPSSDGYWTNWTYKDSVNWTIGLNSPVTVNFIGLISIAIICIREMDLPDYPELKMIYINLDPYYGKKYFDIYSNVVNYEGVMNLDLGLFCLWCKFTNDSLRLYCNTFEEWGVIKSYMRDKCPQAYPSNDISSYIL